MIYVVEDDSSIRELVVYTLNQSGLSAQGFANAREFWAAMADATPRLVLLDIMLPDEDGLTILKKLRSAALTASLPVIMLTAKGSEYDRVLGLDSGADDYVPKPFGIMELLARVRGLLRRTEPTGHKPLEYHIGELSVYPEKRQVVAGGQYIQLTLKEFELLMLLLENENIVLSRDRIFSTVWGYDFDGETRTVDVHIRTLRRKLGSCGDYIQTVRGVGYKIGEAQ